MHAITRRDAMLATAAVAAAPLSSPAGASPAQDAGQPDAEQRDTGFVKQAGMTDAEAECWRHVAKAAGAFFALPELHPMDKQEVASAIHIVQNKLLSRPTYRKYLELAKAAAKPGG